MTSLMHTTIFSNKDVLNFKKHAFNGSFRAAESTKVCQICCGRSSIFNFVSIFNNHFIIITYNMAKRIEVCQGLADFGSLWQTSTTNKLGLCNDHDMFWASHGTHLDTVEML
jgi:hypothetical protein